MNKTDPLLTLVIATRNDRHCGDNEARLINTLEYVRNRPNVEVIIVDWNSDSPFLDEWEDFSPSERFIIVGKDIASRYPLPFTETVALNTGIRRAHGKWIARLDQDIIIGPGFWPWFSKLHSQGERAYFALRRELDKNNMPGPRPSAPLAHGWPVDLQYIWRGSPGILLAPKDRWHALHGYDEKLVYRNHMEHDLCVRFDKTCGLVNITPVMSEFYHQWHGSVETHHMLRLNNPFLSVPELYQLPLIVNEESWGLADEKLRDETPGDPEESET